MRAVYNATMNESTKEAAPDQDAAAEPDGLSG